MLALCHLFREDAAHESLHGYADDIVIPALAAGRRLAEVSEDVRVEEIRRRVLIAGLDQIENAEMLVALERQATVAAR